MAGRHAGEISPPALRRAGPAAPRLAGTVIRSAPGANRGFHQRAALWLAGSRGIRQFIDIGSGLPAQNNTHQAVQKAAPEARVVYADHDRLVGAYAGALLTGDGSRWSYAGVARLPRSSRPGRAGPR